MAIATCPSSAAALIMALTRLVPSTTENSVCRRRWTNMGAIVERARCPCPLNDSAKAANDANGHDFHKSGSDRTLAPWAHSLCILVCVSPHGKDWPKWRLMATAPHYNALLPIPCCAGVWCRFYAISQRQTGLLHFQPMFVRKLSTMPRISTTLVPAVLVAAALAGCSSTKDDPTAKWTRSHLYRSARRILFRGL